MDEKKVRRHVIFIIFIVAFIAIYNTKFSFDMFDASYYRPIYKSLNITNGTEYHGTFKTYSEQPNGDEEDDLKYAVVEYETERGKKTVVSKLSEDRRKTALGTDVIVLDNGSKAVIQQDLVELEDICKSGTSKKVFLYVFVPAAIGIYILINKFR